MKARLKKHEINNNRRLNNKQNPKNIRPKQPNIQQQFVWGYLNHNIFDYLRFFNKFGAIIYK
jgi:hypothetical protein